MVVAFEQFEGRCQVGPELAERIVEETAKQRPAFIHRHFHRDVDEAEAYDLTVNSSRLGFDGCPETIVAAPRSSGLEHQVAGTALD